MLNETFVQGLSVADCLYLQQSNKPLFNFKIKENMKKALFFSDALELFLRVRPASQYYR